MVSHEFPQDSPEDPAQLGPPARQASGVVQAVKEEAGQQDLPANQARLDCLDSLGPLVILISLYLNELSAKHGLIHP